MVNRQKAEITIQGDAKSIESQSRTISRRRNPASVPVATNNGDAILVEEFVLAYDPEIRAAIIARLVKEKNTIAELITQEERLSRIIEASKLAAIEQARAKGIATARRENAKKMHQLKEKQQKDFIENDLPQLLDSCDFLDFETMKTTVESFAEILKIQLIWEETNEGYACTAKPTG